MNSRRKREKDKLLFLDDLNQVESLSWILEPQDSFKYSIYERFKKLNKDIDEIERLERE